MCFLSLFQQWLIKVRILTIGIFVSEGFLPFNRGNDRHTLSSNILDGGCTGMCIVKEAIYRMSGSEGGGHSLPMFFILVIDRGECFCGHVCACRA